MSVEVHEDLLYTENHEWIDPDRGWVGISDYAQEELGDIVFVELPAEGEEATGGEMFMTVESMKAVSDVYSPVDGRVVEVNEELEANPQHVNEAPYEEGRLARLEISGELENLMDADEYREFLKNQ